MHNSRDLDFASCYAGLLGVFRRYNGSGLGLPIVVARDVGLLEKKRNELLVWLGGFLFLR